MAEPAVKLPEKAPAMEGTPMSLSRGRQSLENFRREVDRLFEDFGHSLWRHPLRRWAFDVEPFFKHEISWGTVPAVDIAEKDKEYEITAELPGMAESDIEIKLSNNALTIRGEKKSEKEERKKDFYLSERRFGVFERRFHIPEGVDPDRISAVFKNGVLTVTLPKTEEAQKAEKKIAVRSA